MLKQDGNESLVECDDPDWMCSDGSIKFDASEVEENPVLA